MALLWTGLETMARWFGAFPGSENSGYMEVVSGAVMGGKQLAGRLVCLLGLLGNRGAGGSGCVAHLQSSG